MIINLFVLKFIVNIFYIKQNLEGSKHHIKITGRDCIGVDKTNLLTKGSFRG